MELTGLVLSSLNHASPLLLDGVLRHACARGMAVFWVCPRSELRGRNEKPPSRGTLERSTGFDIVFSRRRWPRACGPGDLAEPVST